MKTMQTFYHVNGRFQKIVGSLGKRQFCKTFYPSGIPESIYACDEMQHGQVKTWWKNGNLKSSFRCIGGSINGNYTKWYKNGNRKVTATIINEKYEGLVTTWYENKVMSARYACQNDLIEGIYQEWYENESQRCCVFFKNGIVNGLATEWHKNGQLKTIANFDMGVMKGERKIWDERGSLLERGTFENGKCHGVRYVFYENGQLKTRSIFDHGILKERKGWSPTGLLILQEVHENGIRSLKLDGLRLKEKDGYSVECFDREGEYHILWEGMRSIPFDSLKVLKKTNAIVNENSPSLVIEKSKKRKSENL